jgi:hypothetical protein
MTSSLSVTVIERNEDVQIAKRTLDCIEDIVSWRIEPTFLQPGRTAWHKLSTPIKLPNRTEQFNYVKLKGVGAWNPQRDSEKRSIKGEYPGGTNRPTNIEFVDRSNTVHFGVGADSSYFITKSASAPFGAITVIRALQEYSNALALNDHNVPSILPIAAYRYDEIDEFNGVKLGAVASLAPTTKPYPMDFLLWNAKDITPDHKEFGDRIQYLFDTEALQFAFANDLTVETAYRVGRSLRLFAAAGLYRHSSGWDNFLINDLSGEIFFTDLDSSLPLDNLKPGVRGQQALRDLCGALYRLANRLYHPSNIRFLDRKYLRGDSNLFDCLIAGYFGIEPRKVREHSRPLMLYFISHFELIGENIDIIETGLGNVRKSYKMDMCLFFGIGTLALYDLYRSNFEHLNLPPIIDRIILSAKISEFLGEKSGVIDYL